MIKSNLEQPRLPDHWWEDLRPQQSLAENAPVQTQPSDGGDDELVALRDMLKREEGYRKDVYLDSRKTPTVGVGHKVLPTDNLKVGDRVDDATVDRFFATDGLGAIKAAEAQAAQAGISDRDFIRRLAAVNFQVGVNWTTPFAKTWGKIVNGDYSGAAENLGRSDWAKQTPDRVKRFQGALLALPPKAPAQ